MFEPVDKARVFATSPGTDFAQSVVSGLRDRMAGYAPQDTARVEIYVNTRRMQRRMTDLFVAASPGLLPRIRLITDIGSDVWFTNIPQPVPPLQQRLELAQLIAALLEREPDIAPRSAVFDLADSLARLFDEMHDEGVGPDAIRDLDVSDASGHWHRVKAFIDIAASYGERLHGFSAGQVARQRQVTEAMLDRWQATPPTTPILVAGSTGSRGSTALFMRAVARLPQGALILPGFDFELPEDVWRRLDDPLTAEDHPQCRFARLLGSLDIAPGAVRRWNDTPSRPVEHRNALVSLALRPAPFTDAWMKEGPGLKGLDQATQSMTLIEAPSDRAEANAIALALKKAADDGRTAAFVTPDRTLTRRVTAALDRWRIEPDVSAGDPLSQSPPGRLLRHVAEHIAHPVTAESLLVLLKHPLTAADTAERGQHLDWTRELELTLRREGPALPTAQSIRRWAAATSEPGKDQWAEWVATTFFEATDPGSQALAALVTRHLALAESIVAGPNPTEAGSLWQKIAGETARERMEQLTAQSEFGGTFTPRDYTELVRFLLSQDDVRDPVRPHPNIMIWGTLEARVQGADLVILGGLNDGTWPELPPPDPWLNRDMRNRVGLLLPDRRIGLSAHDFQQAIAAPQIILSRSVRSADAECVPSRWLNRLTNLLNGIEGPGTKALVDMRARGDEWLQWAEALEIPATAEPPAVRPSPRPPVSVRPRQLSVTSITRLIRDPYAIYARYVLGLKTLDPLHPRPDAPLRGTILHKVLHLFIETFDMSQGPDAARQTLRSMAIEVLNETTPWPAARALWLAKLDRAAETFLTGELARREIGTPELLEQTGKLPLPEIDFTLTAKADRIDRAHDGTSIIYDYKTGSVPNAKQMEHFDKQLLLEAVMAENGAFARLGPAPVSEVVYIGLGSGPGEVREPLDPGRTTAIRAELIALLRRYFDPATGYTSRRAMEKEIYSGDYDHLARFGEWDESDVPEPETVGGDG